MIIDMITNKKYKSKSCLICRSEEIYVIHQVNPEFPDDISKDIVFCRCGNCRNIPEEYNMEKCTFRLKNFTNVEDAVAFWNEKNGKRWSFG